MSKSYIEVEAFISSEQEIYCKDCRRRKGIKNGKEQFIYEIGDTPCKACGIMDILDDVEAYSEAFPADVKPVVRGEWIQVPANELEISRGYIFVNKCSKCGHRYIPENDNFCPNCGANVKMENYE